jgi:hypothetical protein
MELASLLAVAYEAAANVSLRLKRLNVLFPFRSARLSRTRNRTRVHLVYLPVHYNK